MHSPAKTKGVTGTGALGEFNHNHIQPIKEAISKKPVGLALTIMQDQQDSKLSHLSNSLGNSITSRIN